LLEKSAIPKYSRNKQPSREARAAAVLFLMEAFFPFSTERSHNQIERDLISE